MTAKPPYRCPKCDAIGQPTKLDHLGDGDIVSLHCAYCDQPWTVRTIRFEAPTPAPTKR